MRWSYYTDSHIVTHPFQMHRLFYILWSNLLRLSPLAMCPGNQWATSRAPKSKEVLKLPTLQRAWYSLMAAVALNITTPGFRFLNYLKWLATKDLSAMDILMVCITVYMPTWSKGEEELGSAEDFFGFNFFAVFTP